MNIRQDITQILDNSITSKSFKRAQKIGDKDE